MLMVRNVVYQCTNDSMKLVQSSLTLQEIPYKYRDEIVLLGTVCDHVMSQIVPNERQLLPEHSDTHSPSSDPEFAVGVGETEETGEKERHDDETTTNIQVSCKEKYDSKSLSLCIPSKMHKI